MRTYLLEELAPVDNNIGHHALLSPRFHAVGIFFLTNRC